MIDISCDEFGEKEYREKKRKEQLLNEKLRSLSFSIAGSKHGARKVRQALRKKMKNPLVDIMNMNKYDAIKTIRRDK